MPAGRQTIAWTGAGVDDVRRPRPGRLLASLGPMVAVAAGTAWLFTGPEGAEVVDRGSAPLGTLVEHDACGTSEAEAGLAPITVTPGQAVTVTVPPTAFLRLDPDGAVLSAATNTGCAPRATDDVVGIHPDGTLTGIPPALVTGTPWVGDFTRAGAFQAQPR